MDSTRADHLFIYTIVYTQLYNITSKLLNMLGPFYKIN